MSQKCNGEAVKRITSADEAFYHDLDWLRKVASDSIDTNAAELGNISKEIWSHPELSYQVLQSGF